MKQAVVIAALLLVCLNAKAELRKCVAPDGKVTYSDVLCASDTTSGRKIKPTSNTMDSSGLREQGQRDKETEAQALLKERDRAAEEATKRQAQAVQQNQAAEATRQESVQRAKDSDAYANCVREVERQSATQEVKAELAAACRTAGYVQRQTGMDPSAINDCVRNVERTGASGKDKARQMATCHGADVKPEPPPLRPKTSMLRSCGAGGCWDDAGRRYNRQGGTLFRDDGKACQKVGNMLHCD